LINNASDVLSKFQIVVDSWPILPWFRAVYLKICTDFNNERYEKMKTISRSLLSIFLILFLWPQITLGTNASTNNPLDSKPVMAVSTSPAQEKKTENSRPNKVEKVTTVLCEKSIYSTYGPALLALIGSLFGALIAVLISSNNLNLQKDLAKEKAGLDRDLAHQKAGLDIGNSFTQWQIEQLSDLYGPLHALFQQSVGLYRHMNEVLVHQDATRFRLKQKNSGEGFDDQVFEICINGSWDRFRTVLHIDKVYGCGYGIEVYFDEIVKIGGMITKVIAEKAGYTRSGSDKLLDVFGQYLAHYSVLERLHAHIKTRPAQVELFPESKIAVAAAATFPNEIHGLIKNDFLVITEELNQWRAKFQLSPASVKIN